ncbi:hypothetical protein QTP88_009047 [Uroleucon formosanum]
MFTVSLQSEFTFLKKCEEIGKVFCTVCKAVFSIEHGGRSDISDIKQHMEKKKHTSALSSASKSDKVTSYFIKQGSAGLTSEGLKIAAEEGMFAFHTIVHNHSFRSMDCTTTLIKKLHERKFSCARTKCESIILNVLAPFAINQIIDELKAVNFATIMIDTSNHKNLKIVPILIRYFDPKTGVQIKVLEFTNLKGETSDILSSYIMEILTRHKLSHKIIAFTGDNCNTNFGGAARRRTKNVFTILNNNLKTNISGIGSAAHILHNAMQTSTDILPIDIDCIVNKIFQYFYIYTVRVEALKEFCDFTNTQYKNVLGSVKTRWLSLQPAVSKIIEMYPALKLYFDTQDKCPTILKSFFSDPVAIIWFHFIQSQLKVVCDTIKRIEGENISACEVVEELEILCGKIKNRKTQNFLTSSVNSMLLELETKNKYTKKQFIEQTNQFYDTFLLYIEKWGNSFEELKLFRWTQLINCPTWNDIQKSLTFILQNNKKQTGWNVDEDILFDKYNHIVEYSLAMPGTNAAIERVFSITNMLWSDEKNRFLVPTIKSIIILKNHFKKYSCNDFYDFLLTQPKLLNAISSSQKYSNDTAIDNKGHDEQSISTQ